MRFVALLTTLAFLGIASFTEALTFTEPSGDSLNLTEPLLNISWTGSGSDPNKNAGNGSVFFNLTFNYHLHGDLDENNETFEVSEPHGLRKEFNTTRDTYPVYGDDRSIVWNAYDLCEKLRDRTSTIADRPDAGWFEAFVEDDAREGENRITRVESRKYRVVDQTPGLTAREAVGAAASARGSLRERVTGLVALGIAAVVGAVVLG